MLAKLTRFTKPDRQKRILIIHSEAIENRTILNCLIIYNFLNNAFDDELIAINRYLLWPACCPDL